MSPPEEDGDKKVASGTSTLQCGDWGWPIDAFRGIRWRLEPSMTQRWSDWLAQAEHDFEQALASQRDGRHDWACFAAHQAGEKAVKALHLAQGQEAWGHVISKLLSQLSPPPSANLIEGARILDNCYVPARSPNGHVEGPAFEHYGSLHSSQAVSHARNVLDFVHKTLAGG